MTPSPFKTLADLTAPAAKPEGVTFASAANGTSDHLGARLRDALQRALAEPEVGAKLLELGVEQRTVPTTELAAFGQQEIGRWAEAVKRSGAQVD